jgi:hypothetical protein
MAGNGIIPCNLMDVYIKFDQTITVHHPSGKAHQETAMTVHTRRPHAPPLPRQHG